MGYSIILADPPWPFRVWNRDTGNGRSAESHYPTMSLEDICRLPVADLAADNCALFLWSVWPAIFDARQVIESWGFEYKTLGFEWIKLNRSGQGFHLGMGYYSRANPEPCLLAIRGRMPVAIRSERNLIVEYDDPGPASLRGLPLAGCFEPVELPIVAPVRKHSQKPDEQYHKIERLYPAAEFGLRLELFARREWPGWEAWGNEIDSKDINNLLVLPPKC